MPKISVIVPVYNVELYLQDCINSIVTQSFSDIEIILVDDGSTDDSGTIIDEYSKQDSRIKAIHKKNSGVSDTRNVGINESTGDYIYIMDSDDFLESNALDSLYNNAISSNADIIIGDHYTFKNNEIMEKTECHFFSREFTTSDSKIIKKLQNMILYPTFSPFPTNKNKGMGLGAPWTKLVKASLIKSNNICFDSTVKGIFDDGLFALYLFQYAKRVSYIRIYLYNYRELPTSLMRGYNSRRISINNKVFQRIEDFISAYRSDTSFYEAYLCRVILYMKYVFTSYLFNRQYEGSDEENYKEFKQVLHIEPYSRAIKNAPLSKLRESEKRIVILARLGFDRVIWNHYHKKL